jgi:hypothetical protein
VAGGSLRAVDERKRRPTKLMAALERSEEAKSGLAMERSGRQCQRQWKLAGRKGGEPVGSG